MAKTLGSVGFFSTYRPPLPLDLFSLSSTPSSADPELHLTDGVSYNYNGKVIPPAALKAMLKRPMLASEGTKADVDAGRLSGLLFVSERGNGLETLYIGLKRVDHNLRVFSFASVYGTYGGVRMEDSGVIAGDYIIYVTTKDPARERRQPWTAVYRTHLVTGETRRLTPDGTADLSPAVSPDGTKIAVASFQDKKDGWQGEIENLMTNIFVIDIKDPSNRTKVIENGGWPTWGSDKVIFFHKQLDDKGPTGHADYWGVFRADISYGLTTDIVQVTPNQIKAITPVAIDANTVAVATIRKASTFTQRRTDADQYRHIEIFKSKNENVPITKSKKPMADHFNPFVIVENNGEMRIGYHRGTIRVKDATVVTQQELTSLTSPVPHLGIFRVSGVFPSFSKDGTKLAFVDNEFAAVWVTTIKGPLRVVYETGKDNSVFSPVWSQDPTKDILYFCHGPSFNESQPVSICAILGASSSKPSKPVPIVTHGNNAFPSTSPDGTRLVYRSKPVGPRATDHHKNLYIREEAHLEKDEKEIQITRLTEGPWTDTHCSWSPRGDWIVFSSTRDKPPNTPPLDNKLDPGYFAVYLVKVNDPTVVVRVIQSAPSFAGHVNHPFFSPDGSSIVVASDLAAVSCDPISLPLFNHSVRPYGDIFTVDIDPEDIYKNENIQTFNRMTHSKYENSTCTWTIYSTKLLGGGEWNLILNQPYTLQCPYTYPDGSESWQMTGHLCVRQHRCC